MNKNKLTHRFIVGTFVSLYVVVSLISTIHVIDFFKLSNPDWLAISLAIAFEIGAAASLAALIALKKMSKWMVWGVFIILAAMQMMGNTFFAYTHLHDYQAWSELFGLNEEEAIFQKRILSIISGAILPLIALGFIKSLVDYIRPEELKTEKTKEPNYIAEAFESPAPKIESPVEEPTAEVPVKPINIKKPKREKKPKANQVPAVEPPLEIQPETTGRKPGNPQVMPGIN